VERRRLIGELLEIVRLGLVPREHQQGRVEIPLGRLVEQKRRVSPHAAHHIIERPFEKPARALKPIPKIPHPDREPLAVIERPRLRQRRALLLNSSTPWLAISAKKYCPMRIS
jgi:hypothetical protein